MSEWFISSICFKKRTTYYLVLSLAINIPLTVYASDNMNRENILKADFDIRPLAKVVIASSS
ncbi:hypothetical protein ACP1JA_004141, partial [Acinetobacter baumannii]